MLVKNIIFCFNLIENNFKVKKIIKRLDIDINYFFNYY